MIEVLGLIAVGVGIGHLVTLVIINRRVVEAENRIRLDWASSAQSMQRANASIASHAADLEGHLEELAKHLHTAQVDAAHKLVAVQALSDRNVTDKGYGMGIDDVLEILVASD